MSLIGLSPIFVALFGLLFLWFSVHYQTLRRLRLQAQSILEEWEQQKQDTSEGKSEELKMLQAQYLNVKDYYEQTAQGLPARLAPQLFGVVQLPEKLP